MVVDVLMAQRHRVDPLTEQRQKPVRDLARLAPVLEPACQARQQAEPPVHSRKQLRTSVRRNIAAGEIHLDPTPTTPWKCDLRKATIRHRRTPAFETV